MESGKMYTAHYARIGRSSPDLFSGPAIPRAVAGKAKRLEMANST